MLRLASLLPGAGGDGSSGFVLTGARAFDYAGYAVRTAGDINGDGIDDVAIGALEARAGGREQAGQTYVIFGRR
jgi:hypothetical protein